MGEKKKFGIKITLVYELNSFPKIGCPGLCSLSLCGRMHRFACQRRFVGWTGSARRQWERRGKRGPHPFSGISKQNTDASAAALVDPGPGGWGVAGAGTALPCSVAFYIQLATVTLHFWWHRKSTDLFRVGVDTVTEVILKQLARLPSKTFCMERNPGEEVNAGLTRNLRFTKKRVKWRPFATLIDLKALDSPPGGLSCLLPHSVPITGANSLPVYSLSIIYLSITYLSTYLLSVYLPSIICLSISSIYYLPTNLPTYLPTYLSIILYLLLVRLLWRPHHTYFPFKST